MRIFTTMAEMGHEQLMFCRDAASGYHGIIAIHSTTLGPAVGGTRFWRYASEEEALIDALRLSRGMTYKCAVAGRPLGLSFPMLTLRKRTAPFESSTQSRRHRTRFIRLRQTCSPRARWAGSSTTRPFLSSKQRSYAARRTISF